MDHTPAQLRFLKMEGVGNDFVVVDGRPLHGMDWSGLAREMCNRHYGVGADGLLVIDTSRIAHAMMRMYNPDGTPDVCGNGLRCIARLLAEEGLGEPSPNERDAVCVSIATIAGVRRALVRLNAPSNRRVTVDMGPPHLEPERVPVQMPTDAGPEYSLEVHGETLRLVALSTGSTHSVVFVNDLPQDEPFRRMSSAIENHPLFPDRTSVMWTRVEPSNVLRLRIWERGVGETMGCGTGACAAAVAAMLQGRVRSPVTVCSAGGALQVEWEPGETMRLTGPAEYVFHGIYPLDPDGDAQ
ncbi:MAG: diaminopimelate epimerase [Chthonomonadales bacterium]